MRRATRERGIVYPVALDNEYEIWALAGEWTIGRENVVLEGPAGASPSASARAMHIACLLAAREAIPFRVLLDGEAPGQSHGIDVGEDRSAVLRTRERWRATYLLSSVCLPSLKPSTRSTSCVGSKLEDGAA